MNEHNHNEQVMYMLGQISSDVKGINMRLDKVNGRLDKHDDAIGILDKADTVRTARASLIGSVVGGVVGFISGIASGFITTKL